MGFPISVVIPGIYPLIQVDDHRAEFCPWRVSALRGDLVQRLPNKSHHFPGTGGFDFVGVFPSQQ